jgi:hypothetical protein
VFAIASQFVNFQSQQDFGRITGSKHRFLGLNDRAILSSSQYYSGSGDWGCTTLAVGTGDGWFGSAVSYLLHCPRTAEIEIRELPHFKSAHKPDRIWSLRQLCSRERFPLLFRENIFAEEP